MTETDLPAPLTPPDCDIRDFAFMPLDVQRLKRSKAWLRAKRKPALGFYMMNLWTASWHERPAGSLEDDDDVLSDLAMCDPEIWPGLREEVLYGWIKAADGRLYNPTVAEKANEAWARKLFQRDRGRRGNEARWGKGAGTSPSQGDPKGTRGASRKLPRKDRAADPSGMQEASLKDAGKDRSGTIKDRKGQGEGQGEEEESFALSSDRGSDAPAPVPGEEATPAKPDPVDEALVAWAAVCVPAGLARIAKATPPRRRAVAARLRDDFGGDVARWRAYLARIAASGFLTGGGERGWKADLDWAVKPANVVRVLEGFHDDRQPREVAAGPIPAVDERYFGRPLSEVRALPKPSAGTPERLAYDEAFQGRAAPHPSTRKAASIA